MKELGAGTPNRAKPSKGRGFPQPMLLRLTTTSLRHTTRFVSPRTNGGAIRTVYKSARFRRERSEMWRETSNEKKNQGNLFTRLLDRYVHHLDKRPLTTKALTSMGIVGVGDIGCQLILGEKDTKFDLKRFLIFTLLGGVLVGPALHYWYGFLNRVVPGTGTAVTLKRLAIDQTVFAVSFIPIFMSSALTLEGKFKDIPSVLSREWMPALFANWFIWIPGNFVNFRFITPKFQVLFANSIALVWNAYLSWASHRGADTTAVGDTNWDNERVQELFEEFDNDGNNKIDKHEFQDLAFSLGVLLDESEVQSVIQTVDQDGDGTIDLREFQVWLHGDGGGDSSDATSLQAMLLKARLNARVAVKSIAEMSNSSLTGHKAKKMTIREKNKHKIITVNKGHKGDLNNVPTQALEKEIEERLKKK